MKIFRYILSIIVILVVACQNNDIPKGVSTPDDDVIEIDELTENDVEDLLAKCGGELDGKEVLDAIINNAVVFEKSFEFIGDKWYDTLKPGALGLTGFAFDDNSCFVYGYCPNGPDEIFICMEYECTYDEANVSILTRSKAHDFVYTAKVIYFSNNTIIFDGVLPVDDYLNDGYDHRRYIYICTLDSDAQDEWEEMLNR